MKNKKIVGSLVVISLVLMLFGSFINTKSLNLDVSSLKTSQEEIRYTKVFENIYIDGNFSDFVKLYDWASGRGDIFDPYSIESVSMIGCMISITNVDYFEVKDCSFFNYSRPYGSDIFAGLAIGNSRFGIIQNNIFTNCSDGISLYENTEDVQILRNTFLGSHDNNLTGYGKGVVVRNIVSAIINDNYIYGYYEGIVVRNARKVYITNNRIETLFGYISDGGISFRDVNDSSIITNDFYNCTYIAQDVDKITSSGNDLQTSSIIDSFNITISGNRFYDSDGNLIGAEQIIDNSLIFCSISLFIVSIIVCFVYFIRIKKKD